MTKIQKHVKGLKISEVGEKTPMKGKNMRAEECKNVNKEKPRRRDAK